MYTTLESNRLVSVEKGTWVQVQALDMPHDGLVVWLRDFGEVKIFRTYLKDQARHYAMYLPDDKDSSDDGEKFDILNQGEFDRLHSQRLKVVDVISNCYKLRRELFNEIIASFIEVFAQGKEHLNPKFQNAVNA